MEIEKGSLLTASGASGSFFFSSSFEITNKGITALSISGFSYESAAAVFEGEDGLWLL